MARNLKQYQSVKFMKAARAKSYKRKPKPETHNYVLGKYHMDDHGNVMIHALQSQPGDYIDDAAPLTPQSKRWYRWRTRQSVHQWRASRVHLEGLHVINLDMLEVTK